MNEWMKREFASQVESENKGEKWGWGRKGDDKKEKKIGLRVKGVVYVRLRMSFSGFVGCVKTDGWDATALTIGHSRTTPLFLSPIVPLSFLVLVSHVLFSRPSHLFSLVSVSLGQDIASPWLKTGHGSWSWSWSWSWSSFLCLVSLSLSVCYHTQPFTIMAKSQKGD